MTCASKRRAERLKSDNDPEWAFRYTAKCRENVEEHEAEALKHGLVSRTDIPQVTELWFPPRDKTKYQPIAVYAKGVCNGKDGRPVCPVRRECLREAIANDEVHGIFGGMSHRERNALLRKLKRRGRTIDDFLQDY